MNDATRQESCSIQSYRDLVAWQKAMDVVQRVYRETAALPGEERFGLVAQMRRAAVSIPSNIAEGYGRHATQEYLRFLRIGKGSLFELDTQIEVCQRLGYNGDWPGLHEMIADAGRVLSGLIRSIEAVQQRNPKS